MEVTPTPYPGELASAKDTLALANEYRRAAHAQFAQGRSGHLMSWAPARLLAIQAIELFLNGYLLSRHHSAAEIRGMQHDFAQRSRAAAESGLRLRDGTVKHLASLDERREYLVARYGPEMMQFQSELNRVTATLEELARKICPDTDSTRPTA